MPWFRFYKCLHSTSVIGHRNKTNTLEFNTFNRMEIRILKLIPFGSSTSGARQTGFVIKYNSLNIITFSIFNIRIFVWCPGKNNDMTPNILLRKSRTD